MQTADALAFRRHPGGGPPVLLLHGYGADRLAWAATEPALKPVPVPTRTRPRLPDAPR